MPESRDAGGLRIGYVLKKYPRLSETFILNEILGCEAAGSDVSIFSLRAADEGRFHADLARVRGPVTYLPSFKSVAAYDSFRHLSALGERGAEGLGRALEFLDRLPAGHRPQLLLQALHLAASVRAARIQHLHAHFMTIAARTAYVTHLLTGVPFTVTAHAKDIYRTDIDLEVFREIAAAAHAIVTVCDANKRWIQEGLLGGARARVERIYNGIPENLGRLPAEERRPRLLLGVGRLVEKKGFDLLLAACHLLKERGQDVDCLIVGDGDQRERLLDLRSRLGLEDTVKLPGALPREEVMQWMSRARVLAAPCLTGADGNRDALPTVILEAMATGLPVVSTPVGGIPEMVEPGREGWLVPEGDAEALAAAIMTALEDEAAWKRAEKCGPEKVVKCFDRRQTLPRLLGLFAEATSREIRAQGSVT